MYIISKMPIGIVKGGLYRPIPKLLDLPKLFDFWFPKPRGVLEFLRCVLELPRGFLELLGASWKSPARPGTPPLCPGTRPGLPGVFRAIPPGRPGSPPVRPRELDRSHLDPIISQRCVFFAELMEVRRSPRIAAMAAQRERFRRAAAAEGAGKLAVKEGSDEEEPYFKKADAAEETMSLECEKYLTLCQKRLQLVKQLDNAATLTSIIRIQQRWKDIQGNQDHCDGRGNGESNDADEGKAPKSEGKGKAEGGKGKAKGCTGKAKVGKGNAKSTSKTLKGEAKSKAKPRKDKGKSKAEGAKGTSKGKPKAPKSEESQSGEDIA